MSSLDPAVQFAAVQSARKILSRERNPPIEALIATGTIPRFVEFLAAADKPKLQFEVRVIQYEIDLVFIPITSPSTLHGPTPFAFRLRGL